jgi:hypothetical protein
MIIFFLEAQSSQRRAQTSARFPRHQRQAREQFVETARIVLFYLPSVFAFSSLAAFSIRPLGR